MRRLSLAAILIFFFAVKLSDGRLFGHVALGSSVSRRRPVRRGKTSLEGHEVCVCVFLFLFLRSHHSVQGRRSECQVMSRHKKPREESKKKEKKKKKGEGRGNSCTVTWPTPFLNYSCALDLDLYSVFEDMRDVAIGTDNVLWVASSMHVRTYVSGSSTAVIFDNRDVQRIALSPLNGHLAIIQKTSRLEIVVYPFVDGVLPLAVAGMSIRDIAFGPVSGHLYVAASMLCSH